MSRGCCYAGSVAYPDPCPWHDTLIPIDGEQFGTAHAIAHALGPDVSSDMVENWARRDGLQGITTRDDDGVKRTRYPLRDAAHIEAAKRATRRGRPRILAHAHTAAA